MATILLAEDDALLRRTIQSILVRGGHEVVDVKSLGAAIEWFRQKPFDVVITDIGMPDFEGMSLIKRLSEEFSVTRIIAMSAERTSACCDLALAKRCGAIAGIEKPFAPQDLLNLVAWTLECPTLSYRSNPGL
jgi:DNA-binding NtrC family response regulator